MVSNLSQTESTRFFSILFFKTSASFSFYYRYTSPAVFFIVLVFKKTFWGKPFPGLWFTYLLTKSKKQVKKAQHVAYTHNPNYWVLNLNVCQGTKSALAYGQCYWHQFAPSYELSYSALSSSWIFKLSRSYSAFSQNQSFCLATTYFEAGTRKVIWLNRC